MKTLTLISIFYFEALYSQSIGFTLHGMLTNHPYWVNSSNVEISSISFSFNENISTSANSNIDSNTVSVAIISDDEDGASLNIILTKPTNCMIGSHSIDNDHIHFIKDNTTVTSNQTLTFIEGVQSNLKLRFSNEGSYGDKHGAVQCSSGLLTYSY